MRLQRMTIRVVISVIIGIVAWGGAETSAAADMLPFIVDHTQVGETYYWWSSGEPQHAGPVDAALFGEDATGIARPAEQPGFRISRVFQRPDIRVVNAQHLAQMVHATSFFLGTAQAQTTRVQWLDSTAARITIKGILYDTRSGAKIGKIEIEGRGVGSSRAQAVRVAARIAAADLRHFQPDTGDRAAVSGAFQIVIRAHDGAETYRLLREYFTHAVSNHGDVKPCRASEGEVALCVYASGGDLAPETWMKDMGSSLPNIVIDAVHKDAHHLYIQAHRATSRGAEGRDGGSRF